LNAQPGCATNEVEGIEQFLNIEQRDVPTIVLGRQSSFEGFGGTAMASAGVMEDDR
jgi:hypothetical protein